MSTMLSYWILTDSECWMSVSVSEIQDLMLFRGFTPVIRIEAA